jgi:stage II sporulation protein GA (sporulation sigma-E factor processing peptidase)
MVSALLRPISSSLSWIELLTGTLLAFGLLLAVKSGYLTNLLRRSIEYSVEIEYQGNKIAVNAIMDTGNALYSTSRKPVIVVEYQALRQLLSMKATAFFENYQPEDWLENLHLCEDKEWLARVQLIPYRALAGKNMLIAFRPSIVRVRSVDSVVETSEVVVGVYTGKFSVNGQYAALLHPAILKLSVHEEVKTCASPG